jgi:AhpD family alkylhydroperoxidase
MDPRFDLQTDTPDAFRRISALEAHARRAVGDDTLYLLVKVRASFLNGCAFCIDMHATHLAGEGEDWRRILAVAAWRESSFFTPAERAALALTDEVTRLGEHGVADATWDAVVEHHGGAGAADLVVAVATINVWNRLAVAAHAPTPPLAATAAA